MLLSSSDLMLFAEGAAGVGWICDRRRPRWIPHELSG